MERFTEEALEEAIKTVRKLDAFNDYCPVNFIFPTIEQMLAMPRDRPLQIDKLRWQVLKKNPIEIASIGITLANGSKSPMFTGKEKNNLSDIKEMEISQQIKTIVASRYKGYCSIQNLEFRN